MAPPKVRIYELSKALNCSNKEVMTLLSKEFNVSVKSHSSSIDQDLADRLVAMVKEQKEVQTTPRVTLLKKKKRPEDDGGTPDASKAEERETEASKPSTAGPIVNLVKKAKPADEKAETESPPSEKPSPLAEATLVKKQDKEVFKPTASKPNPGPTLSPAKMPINQGLVPKSAKPAPPKAPDVQEASKPVDPAKKEKPASTVPPHMRKRMQAAKKKEEEKEKEKDLHVLSRGKKEKKQPETPEPEPEIKEVNIEEQLTVADLADLLGKRETEIIKHVFMKGVMVTVNQSLDPTFARTIARELGFEVDEPEKKKAGGEEYSSTDALDKKTKLDESKYKNLEWRSPVISIMGHVDHGKTSLLDAIRETRHKIVDTEAGGITQSIGAYSVDKDGKKIVFLDTPGHEAFTAMRMRGAKSTDIAILVVAADDGVMPQTIEAINHAKAAQIPIIVAVNKIDKENSDADRVLTQLIDHGLTSEEWGGDTLVSKVSALQKTGLEELLDQIILVAELLDLKGDPTVSAEGIIIEARLDKQKGPLATALVQNGTLNVGDNILIGPVGGRVRALIDDYGERVPSAGPATPVEILGLSSVPNAGDKLQVIENDKKFKQMLSSEKSRDREARLDRRQIVPGMVAPTDDNEIEEKELNFILKADTQGSAEAAIDALGNLSSDEVKVKILHSGTGDISEADIMLASASQAIIIGFNAHEDQNAGIAAEKAGVSIRKYDVIYHMTEEVEKIILGQLSPETYEEESGQAEVRELFKAGKTLIAGCMVTDGKILRNCKVTLTRGGEEIFRGTIANLKRFKEDVKEVTAGFECGITIHNFNDFQEGDIITALVQKEKERTSDSLKRSNSPV